VVAQLTRRDLPETATEKPRGEVPRRLVAGVATAGDVQQALLGRAAVARHQPSLSRGHLRRRSAVCRQHRRPAAQVLAEAQLEL